MHHIPKEHCCRGQCKADAQREYKQCQQRIKRQKHGGVQLGSCYKHYNNESNEREQTVHQSKAHPLQRKDVFWDIHLFDERRRAQHAAHGAAGSFIEKVEQQLPNEQIYGKFSIPLLMNVCHGGGVFHAF